MIVLNEGNIQLNVLGSLICCGGDWWEEDPTDSEMQEIQAAIAVIEQKLPFLITLTPDERCQLVKMEDKSLAFVSNSLNAAQANEDILPRSFDLAEFQKDYQLTVALTNLVTRLRQLTEPVDDTLMAVGSEAMTSSLTIYEYVKTAAKKTPGMKTIADQLGERFKTIATNRKNKKATP